MKIIEVSRGALSSPAEVSPLDMLDCGHIGVKHEEDEVQRRADHWDFA
jgi:hypothetical protein